MIEERIINKYGALISVFSDGSVWIHRGSRSKRRFGETSQRGYKRIHIRDNGVLRNVAVHRLVAEAYIPNPDNLPQVNHLNGIKTDNRPENLEWCTNEQNLRHRDEVLKHYPKSKPVICVETGEEFRSLSMASKTKKIPVANISRCISGERRIAGGYHWVLVATQKGEQGEK